MPADGRPTALQRDATLAVVALALLTAPVWVPATDVGTAAYAYESTQVVVDDEDGIAYANDTGVPLDAYVSEEIACTNAWAVRPCAFEQYLAANDTIPSSLYTSNPSNRQSVPIEPYRYAQVDGTVYETTYVANRSARNDEGMYRLDLALEPTDTDDALRSVSLPASADRDAVAPVVVEAAREGRATAHREVDVPETPIRLDDGTYHRVYADGSSDPDWPARTFRSYLPLLGPLLGAAIVAPLLGRVEVTYVGDER